jgi:hypothetical protein
MQRPGTLTAGGPIIVGVAKRNQREENDFHFISLYR